MMCFSLRFHDIFSLLLDATLDTIDPGEIVESFHVERISIP